MRKFAAALAALALLSVATAEAQAAPSKAACIAKAKKKHGTARAKAMRKCKAEPKATPAPAPAPAPAAPQPRISVEPVQVAPGDIVEIHLENIPEAPAGSHYKAMVFTEQVPPVEDVMAGRGCAFVASKDWVNPVGGIVLLSAVLDTRYLSWCVGRAHASLNVVPDAAPANYTGTAKYFADFTIG